MTFNAGAVTVTLDGDSKSAESAFKRVGDAMADFESRSKRVGDAVFRATSRVDELRLQQQLLTRALVEAAEAVDRDEGKVHALRLELEQTTGSLNRLTGAQQASVAVQQKIAAATTSMSAATTAATTAQRGMGGAVLEASRAFEDMQYGIAGVLNNIPSLVMSLGGGMGLAGVLSLVLVAAAQVTKHWPEFGGAAETAIENVKASTEGLRGEIEDLDRELRSLQTGVSSRRLEAAEDVKAAIDDAGAKIAAAIPGGRIRFDMLMQLTKGDSSLLPDYGSYNFATRDQYVSPAAFEAAKAAAAALDAATAKYGRLLAAEAESKAQREADNAVEQANRDEAAFQTRTSKSARDAEANLTPTQEYSAVESMFVDVKAAGTKSTASWANPTITPEDANELAGMQSDAEKAIVVISDVAYATADEIAQMNADFASAGSAAIDLRSPLERFGEALANVDFGDIATATATGGLSAGGVAAGTAIGGVVDVATGGATGGLGAIVGGILGGVLGRLLDELIGVLGVLTPVFDALALVVGALSPIFMVVGVLLASVSGVIVSLVPTIAALAAPIAALLLVAVRLVAPFLLVVSFLLLVAGAIASVASVITSFVSMIDTKLLRPLGTWSAEVMNGFISFYNAIIDWIRNVEIAGQHPFENFGTKMESISTYVADTIGEFPQSLGDLKDAMGDTADETAKVGRSMSNVPSWYRVPLAEYRAAGGTGGQGGSSGGSSSGNAGGAVFNGPVTFVMQDTDIAKAVRKGLVKMRGVPVGGVRRSNDDDSN